MTFFFLGVVATITVFMLYKPVCKIIGKWLVSECPVDEPQIFF